MAGQHVAQGAGEAMRVVAFSAAYAAAHEGGTYDGAALHFSAAYTEAHIGTNCARS